eukprot:6475219-Amphidinium_carterae.1
MPRQAVPCLKRRLTGRVHRTRALCDLPNAPEAQQSSSLNPSDAIEQRLNVNKSHEMRCVGVNDCSDRTLGSRVAVKGQGFAPEIESIPLCLPVPLMSMTALRAREEQEGILENSLQAASPLDL